MAIGKIEQVKKGKFFRIWDLVAYGVILLLTVALFLAVFLTRDDSPANGIKISYKGEKVFVYDYDSDRYEVLSKDNIRVDSDDGEYLFVTFFTDGKTGFNSIKFDKAARAVTVTGADCSSHKDCVYTPAVKDASSVISCPPHAMLIEPITKTVQDGEDIII